MMAMTPARMEEIISTLNGSRAKGAGARAAVLVDDLLPALRALPTSLKSKPVTASPSASQFNDLLADVAAIHRCLRALSELMNARASR